ncbi:MAG: hypothetical protein KIT84_17190 [Labilithrix sp.]|nr:hypothetical protein [Labilithrix sp.]MCW5812766.1 hypothetical protein [Labilithrix sp.]
MPATFVKGDFLVEAPRGLRAFACPVDTTGRLDAGIAAAVAKRWPSFATWWSERKAPQLGDAVAWQEGNDVIYALVVQRLGTRAKVSWLERAAQSMLRDAESRGLERINVPRLWGGQSGIAGDRAKRVLEEVATAAPVALFVFEQFIRKAPEPELEEEEEPPTVPAPPAPESELPPTKPAPKKKTAAKKKATAAKKKTTTAKKKKATSKKKAG